MLDSDKLFLTTEVAQNHKIGFFFSSFLTISIKKTINWLIRKPFTDDEVVGALTIKREYSSFLMNQFAFSN